MTLLYFKPMTDLSNYSFIELENMITYILFIYLHFYDEYIHHNLSIQAES